MSRLGWVVYLMEYESGWGSRVDETLFFKDKESAQIFVADFNSENTESTTPAWYMVATVPTPGELPTNTKYTLIPKKKVAKKK